jgi:hypothetical protein
VSRKPKPKVKGGNLRWDGRQGEQPFQEEAPNAMRDQDQRTSNRSVREDQLKNRVGQVEREVEKMRRLLAEKEAKLRERKEREQARRASRSGNQEPCVAPVPSAHVPCANAST